MIQHSLEKDEALPNLRQVLLEKINHKTKPMGSLGMLETIALQVGLVQHTLNPQILKPHIVIFAGDHGLAQTGLINPYPQAVTAQMVRNFLSGGAAINAFCRHQGIALKVVDAGVNTDWDSASNHPDFIIEKMGYGTRNYLQGNAMDLQEAITCMEKGKQIVQQLYAAGCNCIGFGEMGIGNSSAAALIMHHYLPMALEDCVGAGTGSGPAHLHQKIATLKQAARYHQLQSVKYEAPELISRIGGYEIAMMAGAYLSAFEQNMVIVVDGFISTAALLLARDLCNSILSHCIFAHVSNEQGHQAILDHLGVKPLLRLEMRLGEGTGTALAIPLVQRAVDFLNEMASFESAGVSESDRPV